MKPFAGYPVIGIAVIVLVMVSVFLGGCTQPAGQPAPANPGQVSPAPITTTAGNITAVLPDGVTITVPANWTRHDAGTSGLRDYGATSFNIANFFSPNAIPGDQNSYTTLSIDLDQNPGTDFELYFNNATLAVGKTYGEPIQMSAHSYTITIAGYKSYELDFETAAVKGTYIFTFTDNGMYIFAFKVPNKPLAVRSFQAEITDVYKSIRLIPQSPVVTPHR